MKLQLGLPLLLAALPTCLPAAPASGLGVAPASLTATAPAQDNQDIGSAVLLETSLAPAQAWLQSQVILTVRVLHSIPLYDDSRLQIPAVEDLRIEPLGEPRSYETRLDGQRRGVIEHRYALFPQRSGRIELPPLLFSATGLVSGGDGQLARPQRIQLQTSAQQLLAGSRPAGFPASADWLPATALSLSETWLPEPGRIHVGDSLTRQVVLQASGVPASLLPEAASPAASSRLRAYREPPRLADNPDREGMHARRQDSIALVFSEPGLVELPAIEVPWWNTQSNRLEIARLPARTIEVLPDSLAAGINAGNVVTLPEEHPQPLLWPWQLSSLLLACTTLATLALWWRARRQPAIQRGNGAAPNQRSLLDNLRRCCQANDPQAARQALDAWARQQPENLARLAARDIELSAALDELNASLYGQSAASWTGSNLWQAISRLARDPASPESADANSLPPLYPRG